MALLSQLEVLDLVRAMIASGRDTTGARGALLQSMKPEFTSILNVGGPPNVQLMTDIGTMNTFERLANGEVPLEIYLRNAELLLAESQDQLSVVRTVLSKVTRRASGAPKIEIANVPERKERIIHTDDTVTFAFMEAGVTAAGSVAKLRVKRFENGQETTKNGNALIYLGTGWLLSNTLLITNHHVVNARSDGEPNSSNADLLMQGANTIAQFDFDVDAAPGVDIAVEKLEAWDANLDYALLRVSSTGRPALSRASKAIEKSVGSIPVNIIQHPGGRSKRFGIRNNLVSATDTTELRYFTDTEGGSSGSPVFNDRWEVVALHRASKYVDEVQFQGKTTAWVNIGTHLVAIIDDIRNRYPPIALEASL